jgi:hypothetical protein
MIGDDDDIIRPGERMHPPGTGSARYDRAWEHLTIARRVLFGSVVLYVPCLGIMSLLGLGRLAVESVAWGWLAAILVIGVLLGLLRCPRCERPFTHGRFWHNTFTRECVHCGLRLGTPAPSK